MKRFSTAFFAIAILASLSIPTLSQEKPNVPENVWVYEGRHKPSTSNETTERQGTEKNPLSIKVIPTEKNEAETKTEKEERDNRLKLEAEKQELDRRITGATEWINYWTFALFLIAGAQAVLFGLQLSNMSKTLEIAKLNAQSAARIERPFLFLKSVDLQIFPEPAGNLNAREYPNRPNVQIAFENVGRTPAIILNFGCRMAILPSGILPTIYPEPDFRGSVGGRAIMAAGNISKPQRFYFKYDPPTTDFDKLKNKTAWFVGFPVIRYEDVGGTEYIRYSCFARDPDTEAVFAVGGDYYNYEEKWVDGKLAESSRPEKPEATATPQLFQPGEGITIP
ncbi:MAG: hypothetical protein KF794_07180 [Xanthobacteraceae bacterium]|nr:hypothetical protein [Xanthobacteraceae bacterium]QYK46445.1 MAG: hypothetical protein KF794_07180 [Xanthobacteraceae bacterium]